MAKVKLNGMKSREFFPGFHGRMIHSEKMTLAYWDIDEGASIEVHSHPHEQVVNMLEGSFELVLDEKSNILNAGEVLVIPSNAQHGGRALTKCRILDVFQPVRDDYR